MIFMGEKGRGSILKKSGKKNICSDIEIKEKIVKNYMLELPQAEEYIGGEAGHKSSSQKSQKFHDFIIL